MNTILSSREKKIIITILQSSRAITLQQIAKTLGVSRRTILRDMPRVYEWFDDHNVPIERSSNKGVQTTLNDVLRKELLIELSQEDIVPIYTKHERMLYIVTELLQSSEVLKLGYFAVALEVSEATISSDLNSVEEWLGEYQLELERKQGYGVHVVGKERNKRRALINIMYEMLDDSQLRYAVKRQIGIDQNRPVVTSKISSKLLNLMDVETIAIIEQAIMTSEEEMGFKFAESSYTALAVHLALALKRIQNNETIKMNEDILDELQHYDEYIVAAKLIQTLEVQTNMDIPEDEIGYVTLHIKGARYKNGMTETSILRFNEMIISNYELTSMINKMIKVASEKTGYNLKQVDSLLIGLVDHIRPAINRIQLNLGIRNPLLDKIKDQYPDIYKISEECSQVITNMIGIQLPEAEIGYIAMHIGSAVEQIKNKQAIDNTKYNVVVTCISGIGTSNMLAQRIKKEFKNINIIDVFASTSLKNEWLLKHQIDVILSTVYFDNDLVPVITVNPLLLENDIAKINQKLQSLHILDRKKEPKETTNYFEHLQRIQKYTEGIVELLEHFIIDVNILVPTYQDLLQYVASRMCENSTALLEELVRRESIGKIVFQEDKVAFLHTRTSTLDVIKVGIFRSKNMVKIDQYEYDTILTLLAPTSVSKEKLEIIGEISSRIVTDPSFLSDLRYMSEESLYHKFEEILYRFFKDIEQ